jgi:hypothetical protein
MDRLPKHKEQAKMTRKPGGKNNALKHGAYAQELILPGESEKEFEELLESLVAEWAPNGVSEEQTILDLAKYMWAKRRIDRYHLLEARLFHYPRADEFEHIRKFIFFLSGCPNMREARGCIELLPEPYKTEMLQELANSKYEDTKDNIERLTEVLVKLLLREKWFLKVFQPLPHYETEAEEAAKLRELMEKNIVTHARLDAMIDKTIKRLAQIKTLKLVIEMQSATTTRSLDDRSAPRLVPPETKDRAA